MHRCFRIALSLLVSVAFLVAASGAVAPVSAAPVCAGCDEEMHNLLGMDHHDTGKAKSGADCMEKAGCFAACAKLPVRSGPASNFSFVRLVYLLPLPSRFEAISRAPEPSPPKLAA
jgi:hypothetical protein